MSQTTEAEKEMIQKHEEVIHNNILPRIQKIEDVQAAFGTEVANIKNDLVKVQSGQISLEKGQMELEKTLINEGKANRKIMNENKEMTNKLLDHVLGKDERESEAKIEGRKQKWELAGKVLVGLVSGGSILALIIQAVI